MSNLQIIRALKKRVDEFGVSAVSEISGISSSSIYFHFQEDRADKVNLKALKEISDAVDILQKEKYELQLKLSGKTTSS